MVPASGSARTGGQALPPASSTYSWDGGLSPSRKEICGMHDRTSPQRRLRGTLGEKEALALALPEAPGGFGCLCPGKALPPGQPSWPGSLVALTLLTSAAPPAIPNQHCQTRPVRQSGHPELAPGRGFSFFLARVGDWWWPREIP